jgi:hypothetical protein
MQRLFNLVLSLPGRDVEECQDIFRVLKSSKNGDKIKSLEDKADVPPSDQGGGHQEPVENSVPELIFEDNRIKHENL